MLYRNLPFLFVGYDVFYCECGRSFDTLTTYEQHCKSDHGEQQYPFKCPICSKRIQHLTSMKRHMTASHSDHRPFGCSLCQKTFKRKDVLTQHLFNVHKIRRGKTAMQLYELNKFCVSNILHELYGCVLGLSEN